MVGWQWALHFPIFTIKGIWPSSGYCYQKDVLLGKPQVSMIFCLLSLQWDDESDSNWAIFFDISGIGWLPPSSQILRLPGNFHSVLFLWLGYHTTILYIHTYIHTYIHIHMRIYIHTKMNIIELWIKRTIFGCLKDVDSYLLPSIHSTRTGAWRSMPSPKAAFQRPPYRPEGCWQLTGRMG